MRPETQEFIFNSLTEIAENTLQMLEAKAVLTDSEKTFKDDIEQSLSYARAHYQTPTTVIK